jgi:hypothetical protein
MLYRRLDEALARARERADASPSDNEYLTELLQASAGISKSDDRPVYRPFYVAAKFLEQARADQELTEASGAKFTGMAIPIKSLLDQQAAIDNGLIVPIGFECYPQSKAIAMPSPAERLAGYQSAQRILRGYRPRRGPV